MKKDVKHPYLSGFVAFIFFLSGITLTIFLSIRPMPVIYYITEFVLCSIIWGILAFKYRITDHAIKNKNWIGVALSIILSLVFVPTHYQSLNFLIVKFETENAGLPVLYNPSVTLLLSYKIPIFISILTFAAISLCFLFINLSNYLKKPLVAFFKGLENYEKIFLTAASTIAATIVIIVFNWTNVFYLPSINGSIELFDVIYTSDTGAILSRDCYVNPAAPENDLRQPLFGIFAMPFGLLAKLVSYILPFTNTYPISMNIIQILLLLLSFIFLSRMLEVGKASKIWFLLILIATFPFMLFALNMEQYIFAVFWAILLIYNSYKTRKTSPILAVAATGSILTSAILVPFLLLINKEFGIIKKGCKILILFSAVFICGGMISIINKFSMLIMTYGGFVTTDSGLSGKFRQFTHFITSCFIAPCSRISSDGEHISYQLCTIDSYHIGGIVLLGLSLLSGFLFRHKYIVQISLYWIGFAFVLICLLGWGVAENGTILYALYIFWAFAVLLMLLIDKLPFKIKSTICGLLFSALMIYNIKHILNIIHFGIAYYPL